MIKVTINGEQLELPDNTTLADAAAKLGAGSSNIIAELNGTIVKNEKFTYVTLSGGDTIELICFVGGG